MTTPLTSTYIAGFAALGLETVPAGPAGGGGVERIAGGGRRLAAAARAADSCVTLGWAPPAVLFAVPLAWRAPSGGAAACCAGWRWGGGRVLNRG